MFGPTKMYNLHTCESFHKDFLNDLITLKYCVTCVHIYEALNVNKYIKKFPKKLYTFCLY